jgi:hypothetical protein
MERMDRFRGLTLSDGDRKRLTAMLSGGKTMSARTWRRIRVLQLLDEGLSVRTTAKAVGQYPREVSRVGKRYLARRLDAALSDEPRPAVRGATRARIVSTGGSASTATAFASASSAARPTSTHSRQLCSYACDAIAAPRAARR